MSATKKREKKITRQKIQHGGDKSLSQHGPLKKPIVVSKENEQADVKKKNKPKRKIMDLKPPLLESRVSLKLMPGLQFGGLLGHGSYGNVWALDKIPDYHHSDEKMVDSNPKSSYILKVSNVGKPKLLDTFRREVHFLNSLKQTKLVPVLHDVEITNGKGIQIMERFDGTMKDLGRRQAFEGKLESKSLSFTTQQLNDMVGLAETLDNMGIIHGDFKITNLLYKDNGNVMKISDFGFSGTLDGKPYSPLIGFFRRYGCSAQYDELPENKGFVLKSPYPEKIYSFANRSQLYMLFYRIRSRLYERNQDGAHIQFNKKKLRKLFELNREALGIIKEFCPQL